ncbi:MAG: hypothetical protein K2K83_05330 [Rikenella sp.]|nr:hypothetical protein [Rikenella sp.]
MKRMNFAGARIETVFGERSSKTKFCKPTAGTRSLPGLSAVEHGFVARPPKKEFYSFCESKIEMKFPRATRPPGFILSFLCLIGVDMGPA